jgi:DnaJ-class molecular chaperone
LAKDPYQILGVARSAASDEIRAAYRKLAKLHHPDLNPGNKAAEERFKAISSAYDVLDDDTKRARYDAGEIDGDGQVRTDRHFEWAFAEANAAARGGRAEFEDIGDIFHEFLGGYRSARGRAKAGGGGGAPRSESAHSQSAHGQSTQGPRVAIRGSDVKYTMDTDFIDAALGAKKRVTMHDGRSLEIIIPKGLKDGVTLRLKGQGFEGQFGGEAGDALVEMHVHAHPVFKCDGNDIRIDFPVSLREAVMGGKVEVPTIYGPVAVNVPRHANSGLTLRLKGKGINDGDQFVTLKVMLPKIIDREFEQFLARWAYADYDPRKA